MTWKSYAAASGATVLAGWIASAPAVEAPVERRPAAARAQGAVAESRPPSDIEEQAARLQVSVRRELAYSRPHRNPFRFEEVRAIETVAVPVVVPEAPADASAAPALPLVTLAGIAEDRRGDAVERTAVLSSSSGVHLVRTGDELLGLYRVGTIDSEAVDLVSLGDGSTTRLTFASPASR
jgi:hypothetical protein